MGNWPQKVSVSTKEPSQTFSPLQLVKVFTVWLSDKAMRQLVERMNQSQVCLWLTLRTLWWSHPPKKVGNYLKKESILFHHGCWHFVLVNRLLTIPAYHYNSKLQPRGRSWILMKSSQANSQLRNQSQVINIFLTTKWTNTIKDKIQWESLPGTGLAMSQCNVLNAHFIIYEGLTSRIGIERTILSNE